MNQSDREIELSQGMIALVNDDDYGRINSSKWCVARGRQGRLVAMRTDRNDEQQRTVLMHREIIGENLIPKGFVIDHINGNPLDNRRQNLRICKRGQNTKNCKKYTNNTTGFMGVHYNIRLNKWTAKIQSNGISYWLGTFVSPMEAAMAYDEAASDLHNEFATLNFPNEPKEP